MIKVYIDGQAGTTGLEIVKRLQDRKDIELLMISEEKRCRNKKKIFKLCRFSFPLFTRRSKC